MIRPWQHFLNAMTAAAFAEAAEFDTAREMAATLPTRQAGGISGTQRHWAAVAFAEAGEFETACEMLGQQPTGKTRKNLSTLTDVCTPC